MTGINGGDVLTTGFGTRNRAFRSRTRFIDAVKAGGDQNISSSLGGCDGAKPGRNYYTDFVRADAERLRSFSHLRAENSDSTISISAKSEGFRALWTWVSATIPTAPIKVALALADAFKCGVNELPLTMVLSWYEQKAVCVLLTLLSLGIKNIYLGPTLPAFVSSNVLKGSRREMECYA